MVSSVAATENRTIAELDLSIDKDNFLSVALFNADEDGYKTVALNEIQSKEERFKIRAIFAALGLSPELFQHNVLTYDGKNQAVYGFSIWKLENESSDGLYLTTGNFKDENGFLQWPLEYKDRKFFVNDVELSLQEKEITYRKDNEDIKVKTPYFKLSLYNLEVPDEDGSIVEIGLFQLAINVKTEAKKDPQDATKLIRPSYSDFLKAIQPKKTDKEGDVLARLTPLISKPPKGGGLSLKLYSLVMGYALAGLPCPRLYVPIIGFEEKPGYEWEGKQIPPGIIIELDPNYLPPIPPIVYSNPNKNYRFFEGVNRFNIESSFPSYAFFADENVADMLKENIKKGTCLLVIKGYYEDRKTKKIIPTNRPQHTIQLGVLPPQNSTQLPTVDLPKLMAAHPFYQPDNQVTEDSETITVDSIVVDELDDEIPF